MRPAERTEARQGPRIEFQLDTAQILLVVAGLLALCATSFVLGRWMERDRWKEASAKSTPLNGKIAESDAGADLTFFDTLGARNAEPARQAATPHPAPSAPPQGAAEEPGMKIPAPAAGSDPSPAVGPSQPGHPAGPPAAGEFAVQVFAGDRTQAEKLVASLARKGFAAKILPGASGSSAARVRVVGFKTRADAEHVADRLKREEQLHPWVLKTD